MATIAASPKIVPMRDSGHGFSSKGSLQQATRSVSRSSIGQRARSGVTAVPCRYVGSSLDRTPRGRRPLPGVTSGEASHDTVLSELVNIRSKNRFSVSVLATGPTA
jgi:hypothetical protein